MKREEDRGKRGGGREEEGKKGGRGRKREEGMGRGGRRGEEGGEEEEKEKEKEERKEEVQHVSNKEENVGSAIQVLYIVIICLINVPKHIHCASLIHPRFITVIPALNASDSCL
jgi:hypothetical protein